MKRRGAVLLAAVFALLLLGALPGEERAPVLPASVQPTFQRVMRAVNEQHALGPDARITDISIQAQSVRLQLELGGRKLDLSLVHRGDAGGLASRYFAFRYDRRQWRGHRAALAGFSRLLDREFPATPWFIPGTGLRSPGAGFSWLYSPLELSRRLSMALFAFSCLLGLAGTALLLRRSARR